MHAEKCPVCDGEGKYKDKQCHGCNGKGWIEVQGNNQTVFYIPPYQPYIPYVNPEPWQPFYGGTSTYTPDSDTQWAYTDGDIYWPSPEVEHGCA